ncbi:prolipoprotein diacylglyceryl transferase [Rhizobium ruizarguesonis]|uniref:prolipoprotein diacylglyceryl transferase n=1 Tax=Rhizobium ruizarguesonis TaxID=2081791 RepID=UPI001030EA81|nr:prolipoprotein diacylglyceryl transferase family protein [Rhizobium ruizarguesonis]TBB03871.1 hypothetical protein ELH52_20745 [Rhizobium ruizarguesonis]
MTTHKAVAFTFFDHAIHWYGLAFFASSVILFIASYTLNTENIPRQGNISRVARASEFSIFVLFGALVGGKVPSLLYSFSGSLDINNYINSGMSSFWSLLGAAVSVGLFSIIRGGDVLKNLDVVAMAAPLCILLIRIANHLNADFLGTPTNSFWGVYDDLGISRHPIALYEAALQGALLGAVMCAVARKTNVRNGFLAGIFLVGYGAAKLGSSPFRDAAEIMDVRWLFVIFIGCMLFVTSKARSSYRKFVLDTHVPAPSLATVSGFSLFLATGAAMSLPLMGCSGGASVPNEEEAKPVSIVLSNPDADARCGCKGSQAASLVNTSNSARDVSWEISTRDTSSGKYLTPIDGNIRMNKGAAPHFLGCTIHDPSTNCRFQASYNLTNYTAVSITSPDDAPIYGLSNSPSLQACVSWCSDPQNPNYNKCLPLGVRYYKGIAPLKAMVESAPANGGTVRKADILAKYGATEAMDVCKRGDITTVDGRLTNEGGENNCQIPSEELPTAVYEKLGLTPNANDPLKMITVLPKRVEAVIGPSIKLLNAPSTTIFDNAETAPFIVFNSAGGKQLTQSHGGVVISSASISVPGLPKQTVLATSNGCIAVDEP